MKIIDCLQGSEEWEGWRNRPTASEFSKFITPKTEKYSASATEYAAKIVAKRRGQYTEPPPSFHMDWGTEHEPNAKHAYTKATGREIRDVGFVLPDDSDLYGCSPDGLVIGESGIVEGLFEAKCPKFETLIGYWADVIDGVPPKPGKLIYQEACYFPVAYRPQVQGQLMITGLPWCDFYVWHPVLPAFCVRVLPDLNYQAKLTDGLLLLLREIERIEKLCPAVRHELVNVGETGPLNIRRRPDAEPNA